jgi:cation transport ATPase
VDVAEDLGAGIQGMVNGRHVALGKSDWVLEGGPRRRLRRRAMLEGSSSMFVAVDGEGVGAVPGVERVFSERPLKKWKLCARRMKAA